MAPRARPPPRVASSPSSLSSSSLAVNVKKTPLRRVARPSPGGLRDERRGPQRPRPRETGEASSVRSEDTARVDVLLRAHRAPLRCLFCFLEARSRRAPEDAPAAFEAGDYFRGYFDGCGPAPLGWEVLSRSGLAPRSEVVADFAAARARGGPSVAKALRGRFRSEHVAFDAFETFFAGWARRTPEGLEGSLRRLAEDCCRVVEKSLAGSLSLGAPWWLLDRGERPGRAPPHLDDVPKAAFRCLGKSEWRAGDCYAFCRFAGLLRSGRPPAPRPRRRARGPSPTGAC